MSALPASIATKIAEVRPMGALNAFQIVTRDHHARDRGIPSAGSDRGLDRLCDIARGGFRTPRRNATRVPASPTARPCTASRRPWSSRTRHRRASCSRPKEVSCAILPIPAPNRRTTPVSPPTSSHCALSNRKPSMLDRLHAQRSASTLRSRGAAPSQKRRRRCVL